MRKKLRTTRWALGIDLCTPTMLTAVSSAEGSVPPGWTAIARPASVHTGEGTFMPLKVLSRDSVMVGTRMVRPMQILINELRELIEEVRDRAAHSGTPSLLIVAYPSSWSGVLVGKFQRAVADANLAESLALSPSAPADTDQPDSADATVDRLRSLLSDAASDVPTDSRSSLAQGKRPLAVIAAVAVLAVGAGTAALVRTSSDPTAQSVHDPLEVFYDDDGHVDCRNLYTVMPLSTAYRAGFATEAGRPYQQVADSGDLRTCPVEYRGMQILRNMTLMPLLNVVSSEQEPAESATRSYRGWEAGESFVRTGSDNHGWLTVSYVDSATNDALRDGIVEVDSLLEEVVDGIEDSTAPKVPELAGSPDIVFSSDGKFSCSAFYDHTSLDTATELGVHPPLASGTQNGPEGVIGEDGNTCLITGDNWVGPVEIRTGAGEDVPGYPVPGLDGWEQWSRPTAYSDALWSEYEGEPSTNLRWCRSDDDCVTVIGYRKVLSEISALTDQPVGQVALLIDQNTEIGDADD